MIGNEWIWQVTVHQLLGHWCDCIQDQEQDGWLYTYSCMLCASCHSPLNWVDGGHPPVVFLYVISLLCIIHDVAHCIKVCFTGVSLATFPHKEQNMGWLLRPLCVSQFGGACVTPLYFTAVRSVKFVFGAQRGKCQSPDNGDKEEERSANACSTPPAE